MASNLWEYYSGQGQSLPSLSARSQVYAQYGLGDAGSYKGTVAQNNALLSKLQSGGTPAPTASGGGNASPSPAAAPDYGSYGNVINTLTAQQGQIGAIYDPQITTLQNYMPTIQKKYADILAEITRQEGIQSGRLATQQTTDTGNEKVRQANAGVAEAYGTPEMAAIQGITGRYDQAQQDLKSSSAASRTTTANQQSQEDMQVQQMINTLLGQKVTANQTLQQQIAEAQAKGIQEKEQKRQFDAQLAESQRQANISRSTATADASSKKLAALNADLDSAISNASKYVGKGSTATREALIRTLINKYGDIVSPTEIADKVYSNIRDTGVSAGPFGASTVTGSKEGAYMGLSQSTINQINNYVKTGQWS